MSTAKLDSLAKNCGAAICIIGLTKTPKIEFLPLDWNYRSIRIMTVHMQSMDCIPSFQGEALWCKNSTQLPSECAQYGVPSD